MMKVKNAKLIIKGILSEKNIEIPLRPDQIIILESEEE